MILFITGYHSIPFNRLVSIAEELADIIDEEVVIQKGASDLDTRNARSFKWLDNESFDALMKRARIVVCHAGVGTILDCVKHQLPVIVIPRRKRFGEHLDDHQIEIARAASRSESVMMADNIRDLLEALKRVETYDRKYHPGNRSGLLSSLRTAISELGGEG